MSPDREKTALFNTNSNTKPRNSLETLKMYMSDPNLDPMTLALKHD